VEGKTNIYLNAANGLTVSVGPRSNPSDRFVHVGALQSLANVISLDNNETDTEAQTQNEHVSWRPAPFLELLFDLGDTYDLDAVHFWNYFTEQYDVDQVEFEFIDLANATVGNVTVTPATGVNSAGANSNTIVAKTFTLAENIRFRRVTTLLSSTNGELHFNNIGFTASCATGAL
jgi:hypothetical protein